jgi:Zn ribbon nucleic-acid-binding protein
MEQHVVECLRCGTTRTIDRRPRSHVDAGECSRCGYVGWASSADLTESVRRVLRERPLERRRLRAVVA